MSDLSANWLPVLQAFEEGLGFREVSRIRHAAGLTWRAVRLRAGGDQTLLEAALNTRLFRREIPGAKRRNMSAFYRRLSEGALDDWPRDAHFHRAALSLVSALLAEPVPPDSSVVGPLVHHALKEGPLLPRLAGVAHALAHASVSWSPQLKERRQALLGRWLARMAQSPEASWVAHWAGTEHGPLGCRAPSALSAFFRREALAPGLAGRPVFWDALAGVAPQSLLELSAPLEALAPPEDLPHLYTTPEASLGLLDLMSSGSQGAVRVGPLMQRAWDCGWRPPHPETNIDTQISWSRLTFMQPRWAAWLIAQGLGQAVPAAPSPAASAQVRPRL